MKQGIHPVSGHVVFRDRSADTLFLMRSTILERIADDYERLTWEDGESYPVVDVDASSASHPFWTGRGRVVDTEGRVERFKRRYGRGR